MTAPIIGPVTPPVTLRSLTPGDRFLTNRWLGEPHVQAWFGSRAAAEAELIAAQSSPSAVTRIIMLEDRPIGYVQAVDAAVTGRVGAEVLQPGSYLADAFIGDVSARGQGHGASALRLIADDILATTFAPVVAALVAIRNEAAVRMVERAGFQWNAVQQDPALGPCWVMIAVRRTP